MVMFAETKAQKIAEDVMLSTEEKIAQLCELDARLDASRSVCNVAPCWRLVGLDALREAFTAWVGPMSNRANCLSNRYLAVQQTVSDCHWSTTVAKAGRLKS